MADNLTHPHHASFGQCNNIPNTSSIHILEVGGSSQLGLEQNCEISYEHILAIPPITCKFTKDIRLILGVHNLPYFPKKNVTTPTRIVVSTVEDLFLTTLEELVETAGSAEKLEKSTYFNEGDVVNIVLLDDIVHS